MNSRVILHCDINHCYAQIEEMMNPSLREIPFAVGGSEEQRNGIILARNMLAKKYKITTAEPLWQARKKCPGIFFVPPQMKLYSYYTERVKDIYREYTDKVESFGLDEAWIDLTESTSLFGSGLEIAKEIQERVHKEIGLTISIGLSFNKIFSKLGSDMIKPSGLVEISKENYQDVAWSLPCEDLLMVGHATKVKLNNIGIQTIGDIANTSIKTLQNLLGKIGVMLYSFANGLDSSAVEKAGKYTIPKSIGNSWTAPKDITNNKQARIVLERLSQSIASRLREQNLQGCVISLSMRDTKLKTFSKQVKLNEFVDTSAAILEVSMRLLRNNYGFQEALRSIGINVSNLKTYTGIYQESLFEDVSQKVKTRDLEIVTEHIQSKFGFYSVKRASMLVDETLSSLNPKGDHTVFPIGFLKGGINV